jgi:hypothetical protein
MTWPRPRAGVLAIALAVVGLIVIAAMAFGRQGAAPKPRAGPDHPRLMLLTSLPLVFGEEFGLQSGGSKALQALESRYVVMPVGSASQRELSTNRLLLMAQPTAQPSETLVELDRWVRGGGRLLLLADPMLVWPSDRPLGDKLRPPLAFADTGLLQHWGVRLDAPDESGPAERKMAGRTILAGSPGTLVSSRCAVDAGGFVARCQVGKGRVTIVADADFLNVAGPGGLDGPTDQNLDALLAELKRLEDSESP